MDWREAVRLLQEIERPVLLICAEKFSDKIGTIRTSRMIFGDGAAAVVVAPAPEGTPSDIEYFQTYASGPWSEVNSIIWPNPEFDNNITVYGPEVKALVTRYLKADDGRVGHASEPQRRRRVAHRCDRPGSSAPGQQEHGPYSGRGGRDPRGSDLFQHPTGWQHLVREYSDGRP